MTAPTDWEAQVAVGLAELLASYDLGKWQPDTAYADTDVAIVYGDVPSTPDRLITLTPYPVTDDPALSDTVLGMQVRLRGGTSRWDVDDLAALVFDLLHGAEQFELGPARIALAERRSSAPLGQDEARRWSRVDNYYLHTDRPTANRPD